MQNATWPPGCTPAARSRWARRLAAASSSANVTTAPVLAMMYAGLSGWAATKAPGNMPSEGTGSYRLAMDPGAAQFARLEHFAAVVAGDPSAVRLDEAALAMAAVLRSRPTD